MKNYKIKSLLGAVAVSLAFSSCADFLTIEPKTFVSEDNFWNEKADIDQIVAGIYVKMQSEAYIRRCIVWGEVRADNLAEGQNCEAKQTDLYRTLREYLLSSNQYTNWRTFYDIINQCNIIIARAPEVSGKDPSYTQSDVLATQAEVTFIRALSYFYLVRAFKDVPYYTYPIQKDDDAGDIAATDGDVIVRALITDLEAVVSNALKAYPKDENVKSTTYYYDSNSNRVTQNAIYALLADLCLWDNQYQKCIDYAQRVINAKRQEYQEKYSRTVNASSGAPYCFKWDKDTDVDPLSGVSGYPLYPCFSGSGENSYYGNDFDQIFGQGSSFESLFELAFLYGGEGDPYASNTACSLLYGNHLPTSEDGHNEGQGFLAVNESVMDGMTGSGTISKGFDHQYDCRFYANVNTSGSGSVGAASGYVAKFVDAGRTVGTKAQMAELGVKTDNPYGANSKTTITANRNWIFYRLTDVMLMQAEALIESAQYDDYEVMTTDENGSRVPLLDANGDKVTEENLKKAFALIYAVNRRSIIAPTTGSDDANVKSNALKFSGNNATKAGLRVRCLKERRCELMFEGKRWFDLLRYCHREGNATYVKNYVPAKSSGTVPAVYEALFWPYNKYELKNNSLLKQKPYYGEDDTEGNFSSTK